MERIRACAISGALVCALATFAPTSWASDEVYANVDAYLSGLNEKHPDKRNTIQEWDREVGDLNGDGLPDIALVLSYTDDSDQGVQALIVVLAGTPGGGYTALSETAEYCSAQKWYGLRILGRSLRTSGVRSCNPTCDTANGSKFLRRRYIFRSYLRTFYEGLMPT